MWTDQKLDTSIGRTGASYKGIAVDPFGNNIYWADSREGTIQWANVDSAIFEHGTGYYRHIKDLLPDLRSPDDIELDLAGSKIY
jgi:DNA-binding beta-propeller fold protein YncE